MLGSSGDSRGFSWKEERKEVAASVPLPVYLSLFLLSAYLGHLPGFEAELHGGRQVPHLTEEEEGRVGGRRRERRGEGKEEGWEMTGRRVGGEDKEELEKGMERSWECWQKEEKETET